MADNALFHKKSRQLFAYLTKKAQQGHTVTYKEAGAPFNIAPRHVGRHLGCIGRFLKKNRVPPIQSLVVYARSRVPGEGIASFVGLTRAEYDNLTTEEKNEHVKCYQNRVREYPQWPKLVQDYVAYAAQCQCRTTRRY